MYLYNKLTINYTLNTHQIHIKYTSNTHCNQTPEAPKVSFSRGILQVTLAGSHPGKMYFFTKMVFPYKIIIFPS